MSILISMIALLLFPAGSAQSQEIFDAFRKGDIQAVKALVKKSPQVLDARDSIGMTPLHYAAIRQNTELIGFFIDHGAKLELKNAQSWTPMHMAAWQDRQDAVAVLLKRGAALETRDDDGHTALILCAWGLGRDQPATCRILIDAGADVNAIDKRGDSALFVAAMYGNREVVDLLLEQGALVPEDKWQFVLHMAASHGLTTLFRRLTDKAQDVKTADRSGDLLLHQAAAGGSAEIVGFLLDKGFDAARPDRFGWSPLHYAARDGRIDAARILIERGAPLDARTIMGQTAYNIALERNVEGVARLLAEKGADKSDIRFPVLEGDFLGQKPPGDKAELFGFGIISSIWNPDSTAVFSPDGNEVYWALQMTFPGEKFPYGGGLMMMKRVNGRWAAPHWAPFSGPGGNYDVPFVAPDGKRIYFISSRPLPGETQGGREKIWYTDRTAASWSEPRPLDPNVNSIHMYGAFSLDREGNVYFGGQSPDSRGKSDIYLARVKDGKYEKPVNLGEPINSALEENSPFIAPDGNYLLFSRQDDLWASFQGPEDGAWSEPIKLGPEVNTPSTESSPMVTADGKYLFFLSSRNGWDGQYWIRADVIEKARPGKIASSPAGEAVVWYLGHCGYAVRTPNHLLIFDYQESRDGQQPKSRPAQPSLSAGWIEPGEIKDLKVRVFVSHSHQDHFDPIILSWKKIIPDIAYYFGWKAADDPSLHFLAGPHAELKSGGLEISTINSHHSGVPEVAWLVKADGLVIYHNGDCQPDNAAAENDFLRMRADAIDLAFVFPVYEEGQKYAIQNVDFFTKFRVKAGFPMHAQAGDARYIAFQKAFQSKFPGLPIHVPMKMGQKFVFEKGRVAN